MHPIIILFSILTVAGSLAYLIVVTLVNSTEKEYKSVYPKWILKRLLRDTPKVVIIKSDNPSGYIMRIYPFRYSLAYEESTRCFNTNPYDHDKEDFLKHVRSLMNKVTERVIDKKVWKITPDELDMWEL